MNLLLYLARHRLAAHLIMALMILTGFWALYKMNTQFLPTFKLHFINITTRWPGASAADIERAITTPIEKATRDLDGIKHSESSSQSGISHITLEFYPHTSMSNAQKEVEQRISQLQDLPAGSEPPIVVTRMNYEPVAKLLIYGSGTLASLRPWVRQWEKELLAAGIAKITITGLPENEISIQIPSHTLHALNTDLHQISQMIQQRSIDIAAGTKGKSIKRETLRSHLQPRSVAAYAKLPLLHDHKGRLIYLEDIASISKKPMNDQALMYHQQHPAVELTLLRTESASTLQSAQILTHWLNTVRPTLPQGIHIQPYFERWKLIKARILLLLKNGFWGLVFVVGLLFLALNFTIARWIALGIPASILGAMLILYYFNVSINMVSLFAIIMTLGIVVDDAIIVAEEIMSRIQQGQPVIDAVQTGIQAILSPLLAASLTTIVAFLPLLFISGIIGQILYDIPLVAICVIVASLIECFCVLPGHILTSGHKQTTNTPVIQPYFDYFAKYYYKKSLSYAVTHPAVIITTLICICAISVSIVAQGYMRFDFFPSPESSNLQANIRFVAGTPHTATKKSLMQVGQALEHAAQTLTQQNPEPLLVTHSLLHQQSTPTEQRIAHQGPTYASVYVELTPPETRKRSNAAIIHAWKKNISANPAIEQMTIESIRGGPPGKDIDIRVYGKNTTDVKSASDALVTTLQKIRGVFAIQNGLSYGEDQVFITPNAEALGLGLSGADISKQVMASFNGTTIQNFYEPDERIRVRVSLADKEKNNSYSIAQLPITTPKRTQVPLESVATFSTHPGFDRIKHINGMQANTVTADIDSTTANMNRVLQQLEQFTLPQLSQKYHVTFGYGGRKQSQSETLTDMLLGIGLAIGVIYIILAWTFQSLTWPLIVLITLPLGWMGALWGHILLQQPITVLSLFGCFGLTGIVINDSIILITRYRSLKEDERQPLLIALTQACQQRLRPILLTSLTTIAGLSPLLFETSLQAQFLIPMATAIVFGLLFSTPLLLLFIPAILATIDRRIH